MAMADADVGKKLRELLRTGDALWTTVSRLPSHVLTADCRARLLKVVQAERNFVARLAAQDRTAVADAHLSSSNFGHLEGIVFVLQNQGWRVAGATAALKSFQVLSSDSLVTSDGEECRAEDGKGEVSPLSCFSGEGDDAVGAVVHIDLICTLLGEAVWVVVINSKARNRLWFDKNKRIGLHTRVSTLLHAASLVKATRPSAIVLLVRDGLESKLEQQLHEEFHATKMSENDPEEVMSNGVSNFTFQDVDDGDWVNIHLPVVKPKRWTSYWIRITHPAQPQTLSSKCTDDPTMKHAFAADSFRGEDDEDATSITGSSSFWSAIRSLKAKHGEFDKFQHERKILNLDTTALVAMVSELTNGGAEHLVNLSSEEREKRYPMMAKFVYEQALVELDEPFLPQFEEVFSDKLLVICEYVYDEFTSVILLNAGPREKLRAHVLFSQLKVVPNLPSARVNALPETGKIKPRHKLVFGCGDFLQAPTVTANMSFVRAVQQQGVPVAIIQHQPCAFIGD
ncbi:uncharacterized protein [Physcomitrium patens]|uniref:DUF1308 domain-containing protein n=1 Tax=Physcomitrium patens TaxID=3218 RepID=A9RZY9_PHYPA|nr:UPF0415 protein C7orf25 homolog [Physcomitrium patens]PNR61911.1 hypothetical protein PHYPA_000335 [Physcomitrium patens]|eukprot:XP_024376320.1 UPF0415 protein C7orf25 homolog [Physcomitrella patens]